MSFLAMLFVMFNLIFVHFSYHHMIRIYKGEVIYSKPSHVLFHQDGKSATVIVSKHHYENNFSSLSITTNGKPDASIGINNTTKDEGSQVLLGAIPMSIAKSINKIAVIGLGSGMTSHILLLNPKVLKVDTIEIEPAMVQGAKLFYTYNKNIYTDPRSHIIVGDAKSYFSNGNKKYDVIVSEPSDPWVSGISNLFSKEFYGLVSKHLSSRGLFCQWLATYSVNFKR